MTWEIETLSVLLMCLISNCIVLQNLVFKTLLCLLTYHETFKLSALDK